MLTAVMRFDLHVKVLIPSLWHSWEVVGLFVGGKDIVEERALEERIRTFLPTPLLSCCHGLSSSLFHKLLSWCVVLLHV